MLTSAIPTPEKSTFCQETRLFRAHARMRSQLQPVWSDGRIHPTTRRKNANQLRPGGRDVAALVARRE
jgi:hypothetical protein